MWLWCVCVLIVGVVCFGFFACGCDEYDIGGVEFIYRHNNNNNNNNSNENIHYYCYCRRTLAAAPPSLATTNSSTKTYLPRNKYCRRTRSQTINYKLIYKL